jgi:hypothetical protein
MEYFITIYVDGQRSEYLFYHLPEDAIRKIAELSAQGKQYTVHKAECIADLTYDYINK